MHERENMTSIAQRRDKSIAGVQKRYEAGELTREQAHEKILIIDEAYDDARRRRKNIG